MFCLLCVRGNIDDDKMFNEGLNKIKSMDIIKPKDICLRLLREKDKNLLFKWLTDERVLNFWEGKSAFLL